MLVLQHYIQRNILIITNISLFLNIAILRIKIIKRMAYLIYSFFILLVKKTFELRAIIHTLYLEFTMSITKKI